MSTIFELTGAQLDLKQAIENGELTDEMAADTFEGMEHELDAKLNDYCRVINSMNADLTTIENEIKRLQVLQGEKKNQIKQIKKTLVTGLSVLERTNFDTGLFKGHIRKGSQSVNVINESQIPADFIETIVTEKPDKTAIKQALKMGEVIPGCELKTGDSSLIIK
jgi:hypothetical protein